MAIMTHGKFHFNLFMLTLIFSIRARRTTEKARPNRVNQIYLSSIDKV